MSMLKIKCPTTGKLVPTGMDIDENSFESMQMSGNQMRCEACGNTHTWGKKDVDPQTWSDN